MPLPNPQDVSVHGGIAFRFGDEIKMHGNYYASWKIYADAQCVCFYTSGALNSCALGGLSGFRSADFRGKFFTETKNIDALASFLDVRADNCNAWNPKEFIFVLGPSFRPLALVEHPLVKEVDAWKNKSHDGWVVRMYRLSLKKDFDETPS